MEKESSHGIQETYTKVDMKKTKEMDTGRCIGMMEVFIKGTGLTVISMVKEYYLCQMALLDKEPLKTINFKNNKI
jgi:hypothetical protein